MKECFLLKKSRHDFGCLGVPPQQQRGHPIHSQSPLASGGQAAPGSAALRFSRTYSQQPLSLVFIVLFWQGDGKNQALRILHAHYGCVTKNKSFQFSLLTPPFCYHL